ncbi:MAG: hypothetical protein ASUL_05141 [Candidatus Aramenus sulfurataquae]|uniref:Trm112 family protein n=2 Tax=Candidatus Aramenus sulfurataquae TaxID=1326980 RepID=W7KJ32_9CREN|nr:MAG: hypothetical protein ASUL_05141 [Candidatus Aramenus sulfurataquae]MCL7343274.1 Trm112 family protein [Candidatus Aramenus sulfurataquae]
MKYRLMDLLACPMCKKFPLELYAFEVREVERNTDEKKPLCELYCAYKGSYIKELQQPPPCDECFRKEIVEGLLFCTSCKRWYPIIDEIPRMLPDNLRKKEEDLRFLEKNKTRIPKEVLESGLPVNMKS